MELGEFDATGFGSIGPTSQVTSLTSDRGYSFMVEVDGTGYVQINADDGTIGATGSGTNQVETATAAGSISGSGNATVVVTGDDITGSPLTVSVAVTNGDSASTWAGKVRTALGLQSAITDKYTVGGSTTSITLSRIAARYNDSTLNISLDNGTCTGITTAASSVATTAGVNPSNAYRLTGAAQAGDDMQGLSLGAMADVQGVLVRKIAGSSADPVELVDGLNGLNLRLFQTGHVGMSIASTSITNDGTSGMVWTVQPVSDCGYSKIYMTVMASV